MTLEVGGRPLVCEVAIRNVPGQRTVFLGRWGEEAVVIKLYQDPGRAAVHHARELRGIQALLRAGIPTPALLHSGKWPASGWWVIVLRRIEGADTFASKLAKLETPAARETLLRELVSLLADHHRAGLRQTDLHLDNFLVAGDVIYSLDGAGFAVGDRPVGRHASISNLALLLAQFPPAGGSDADPLLEHYGRCRGWLVAAEDRRLLFRSIRSHRRYRERKFLSKIFRECSAFAVHRQGRLRGVFDRGFGDESDRLRLMRDGLDFNPKRDRMLKDGNTCTVWLTERAGRKLVVKRYNLKSLGHRLNRALRRTRAAYSWENAHRLEFCGVGTPKPLGLVEERIGPFRGRAWFLSEFAEGPDIDAFLAEPGTTVEAGTAMLNKIGLVFRGLRDLRISHGDMKAKNILVHAGEPMLIDLDAMRQHRFGRAYLRQARRDRARFLRNWVDSPEWLSRAEAALTKLGQEE